MSVTQRVSDHRQRMRARGYRSIQLWVPDARTPAFAEQARQQSQVVAHHDAASDDQDFIEAVSTNWGDE